MLETLAIGLLPAGCVSSQQNAVDGGATSPPDRAGVDVGLPPGDAAPVIDGTDAPDAPDVPDAGQEAGIVAPPDPTTWAPRDLIAARLSRFLWNQPTPDPAVASAVQASASADDIAEVARGMLADPRARDGLAAFFTWWLRLSDLTTQPKDDPDGVFTPDVRAALQQEAPAFGASVILDGDARYGSGSLEGRRACGRDPRVGRRIVERTVGEVLERNPRRRRRVAVLGTRGITISAFMESETILDPVSGVTRTFGEIPHRRADLTRSYARDRVAGRRVTLEARGGAFSGRRAAALRPIVEPRPVWRRFASGRAAMYPRRRGFHARPTQLLSPSNTRSRPEP